MTSTAPQSVSPAPADSGPVADALQLQFDVVKLDYERTAAVVDGVSRTRTTMRGAAITAYAAFLSLAVQQKSWALAAGAAVVATLFGCYDVYLGWLSHSALRRANRLE